MNEADQNNPYEISKFEKIKKLAYSVNDEILKKYVLEDFLERLKKLYPIQTSRQNLLFKNLTRKEILKF